MKKTKQEKAITLIALIITIVVLLILAVVAINAVTGDGIIQHATNARSEYEKAQAEEEDMLSYYEGVLQSGEVVPTVEQLQEKYSFSYFSSLSRAIENVNGDTTKIADANAENAVVGIYEDSGNKYVVLMKDTEESTIINVNKNMTINLGGKTLSLTADAAYLNFAADTVCTVDGRLGGSAIQKNISTGNGILNAVSNTDLTINSGKYSMEGEFATGLKMFKIGNNNETVTDIVGKNFKVYNANLRLTNKATSVTGTNRIIAVIAENSKIQNCDLAINAEIGNAQAVMSIGGEIDIKESKLYSSTGGGQAQTVANLSVLTIDGVNIFSDVDYGKGDAEGIVNQGTLIFNSGYVNGANNALIVKENARTYIYEGTFEGYLWGGINVKGVGSKTYVENAVIKSVNYSGKYNYDNATVGLASCDIGGGAGYNNNEVYMDNCSIIGVEGKMAVWLDNNGPSTGNILKISNSRVTGTVQVDANQALYLGAGMDSIPDTQITASGTVDRTTYANVSFKGMDNF